MATYQNRFLPRLLWAPPRQSCVNRVVPQLIGSGRYARPALGIEADEDLNRVMSRRLGVPGVVALKVDPGSAAAAAGLRGAKLGPEGSVVPGDIIESEADREAGWQGPGRGGRTAGRRMKHPLR